MNEFRKLFWRLLILVSGQSKLFKKIVYLEDWRNDKTKQLHDLICFANNQTPFYRGKFNALVSGDVRTIEEHLVKDVPITDKQEFKRADKELLAEFYKDRFDFFSFTLDKSLFHNLKKILFQRDYIFSLTTGGTTGSPLISYKNKQSLLTDGLLFFRGWKMMGWKPGDKVLWFYNSYYDNSLSFINLIFPLTGIRLFFFDSLSDKVIGDFVSEINSFKPKIIVTFPSYINDAAATILKNNFKLKHYPDGIDVSGETFFSHQRANVDAVFKTKSYDGYGTIEFGMVAHECEKRSGMHVYEDIALLESVDHESDPHSLLATRYSSHDVPIIRYKVGDRGILSRRTCECGRSGLMLESVDGRIDDYVQFSDNQRMYPSSFRQILNSCNQRYVNSIIESNLTQTNADRLNFQVVLSDKSLQKEVEEYLSTELRKHLPAPVAFQIAFVENIRGKRKFRFIEKALPSYY